MLEESKSMTFVGRKIDGRGWKLWWCFHPSAAEIVNETTDEFCYDYLEYMENTKFVIVGKQN